MIVSCNQKVIDKTIVLENLKQCYLENKNDFDTLGVALTDIKISNVEIQREAKKVNLKNSFGFKRLFLTSGIANQADKFFNVKELQYGMSCGYLYVRNPTTDSFSNSRLVYVKLNGNWYSYIYSN